MLSTEQEFKIEATASIGGPATLPDEPPTDKPTDEKPKKRPGPAQLLFSPVGSAEKLKAIKYPMPLKAARYSLTINGAECEAAQTTFGSIRYTYFLYNGASFYVPGHHNQDTMYEFSYPENYAFKPLKLDRKAQSEAAAKSKKAKTAATEGSQEADAQAVQPAAAANESAGYSGSVEAEKPLQEPEPDPMSGKKSRRAQR